MTMAIRGLAVRASLLIRWLYEVDSVEVMNRLMLSIGYRRLTRVRYLGLIRAVISSWDYLNCRVNGLAGIFKYPEIMIIILSYHLAELFGRSAVIGTCNIYHSLVRVVTWFTRW